MAKLACKGTVLKQEIASVMTAVAQVISMSTSGVEAQTFETTTLDTSGAGRTYQPTGYTEPGTVDFDLFYDPSLAGHQAITDLATTPAITNWSITFTDAAPTTETFSSAGLTIGRTVDMADGLKMSVSLKLTGLPAFST